mmetsp:Transcript_1014/g.1562  ORF Transcript_1014/g.1562 Transcript_1014/m.1562 type:complete len:80 (-) Transcript_1014:3033-3272(-)
MGGLSGRSNGSSTVDLFITNEPELVLEHTVGGDVNSDHAPTLATLDVNGGAENEVGYGRIGLEGIKDIAGEGGSRGRCA